MNLKTKLLVIICGVLAVLCLICLVIQKTTVFSGFVEQENIQAERDMDRIRQTFLYELQNLDSLCHDWASWDDSYEFVQKQSTRFINASLSPGIFSINRINLVYYLNIDRQVIWEKIYNLDDMTILKTPDFPESQFPADHPLALFAFKNLSPGNPGVTDVLMTDLGPMLVSVRPVLTSEDQGPVVGFLVMGRLVTEKLISRFNEQTGIRFHLNPQTETSAPSERLNRHRQQPITVMESDSNTLTVQDCYADIVGRPALNITAELTRSITIAGRQAVYASLWMMLAAYVITMLTLLITIQKIAIRPLMRLAAHAEAVGQSQDLSLRLNLNRKDEIGRLGRVFDSMIQKLEQAMNQVSKSEELFRALIENSPAHVMLIQNGKFLYINPAAAREAEYSQDEIVGMNSLGMIFPEDRHLVKNWTQENVLHGKQTGRCECRYLTRSGKIRWTEMTSSTIVYKGKPTILTHAMDITEKKIAQQEYVRLEEQLHRAEKMEALGLMAGGVAHDMNNVLGAVVGYAELMLIGIPEESPFRRHVRAIMQSGQKAAAMIQDLLAVTRRGIVSSEVVNLNDEISRYAASLEYGNLKRHHPHVDMIIRLEKDLMNIKGSPVHIGKMIMNLVSNAAESIAQDGVITLTTENRYLDTPLQGYDNMQPGDYAVLMVNDTGTGISPEDISKIFEPFYTKKTMGRSGTGLGLSVVWGTVKDHHGYIDV
ncbi:MAG: hypothetical protein C0403_18635, partial [Desulfobacterium sp.]|nr:hypothetical protein [Desulfobacterium sp.]